MAIKIIEEEKDGILKTLSYNMSIMKPTGKGYPNIWITPKKHNSPKNKESGKVRICLNEKGIKRFINWLELQWRNNLD
jgi:hypothetical protein